MKKIAPLLFSFLVLAAVFSTKAEDREISGKPNILFIAVDDLRPQLFSFGQQQMVTPNIDRLARQSVSFQRAYCMVPTCGASRAALMTGIRPTPKRFINHLTRADEDAAGITTLNTHFKNHGYYTVSLGKIFHHTVDNVQGWSETPWRPNGVTYADPVNIQTAKNNPGHRKNGPPVESADVPDTFYRDGQLADRAVKDLRRLAKMNQPFFLAVGFFKPHLPFVAPSRYWDRYSSNDIDVPDNYFPPKNVPTEALHNFGELRNYAGVPKEGMLEHDLARTLIHGYYACVSYTDTQIQRLLDELDATGQRHNTIVVLWGDHGWNLGEHTLWCKHCCFETSMNAPLIVSAAMLDGFKSGASTRALTEFIDIYPSLCDLSGLPKPEHLEGTSFVPVLKRPDASIKTTAIGRYHDGDTIRTDRYRYTEYRNKKGQFVSRMLYDHQTDPGENTNIAEQPENQDIVEQLAQALRQGMGKDTP